MKINIFRCVAIIVIISIPIIIWTAVHFHKKSVHVKSGVKTKTCGYESCNPTSNDLINIHIIPHTHLDIGKIKTFDQYYYGIDTSPKKKDSRRSFPTSSRIQPKLINDGPIVENGPVDMNNKLGVQYIIDSVLDSLEKNELRKFTWAETAYFWKWWSEKPKSAQMSFKKFVGNGQLQIAGGGWSINDEATTNYQSIIDQFTLGLRRLVDTLGPCSRPEIGWQMDAYGHSREMASILANLGFDGVFISRLDHSEHEVRKATGTSEFIWRGSDSLGETSDIFTSILFDSYKAFSGFCFDVTCNFEPIVDNPDSPEFNVDKRFDEFIKNIKAMEKVYKTNHLLVPMGTDFAYQEADMWYSNMDKLISFGNSLQDKGFKYNFMYSTPSCYLNSVQETLLKNKEKLHVKTDDFFPIAPNDDNYYWTGFYTSRPNLKRFERIGNNFLQICKQLSVLAGLDQQSEANLDALKEAMGMLQHHDAIAGTERQVVANDFARLLSLGLDKSYPTAAKALYKIATTIDGLLEGSTSKPPLTQTCFLTNISQCSFTERSEHFIVTVYNPLSKIVDHYVRLPVSQPLYKVTDSQGGDVIVDIIAIPDFIQQLPGRKSIALYELVFKISAIPPLGFKSYMVQRVTEYKEQPKVNPEKKPDILKINKDSGLIESVNMNGVQIELNQEFLMYDAGLSGSFLFEPTENVPRKIVDKAHVAIFKGQVVTEMHQNLNEWLYQIIRLYADENVIEFDWIVGPLPKPSNVITRYSTKLNTESTFFTDSNGKQTVKRVRDFRPTWNYLNPNTVGAQYYPVTSKISLKDMQQNIELTVLTDRPQGGSSINDGQIELMLHRRCAIDDALGLDEVLNEQSDGAGSVVRGSHFLVVGPSTANGKAKSTAAQQRDVAQKMLLDGWTFLTETKDDFKDYKTSHKLEFSGLLKPLPDNVQILTLESRGDDFLLLRLEHLFEKGEDTLLSKSATVDLQELFDIFDIVWFKETTLGGNEWLENKSKLKFLSGENLDKLVTNDKAKQEIYEKYKSPDAQETAIEDKDFKIVLRPMQIRTFVLKTIRKSNLGTP